MIDITEEDLERGISSMIERGLVPTGFSIDNIIGGGGSGPLVSAPASLHKHTDQFKRSEVMTTNLGFGSVMTAKLDLGEIEKIPAKASYAEIMASKKKPFVVKPPLVADPNAEALHLPAKIPDVSSSTDLAVKEREDPRTYTELLDLYSLHEFIIRKGQTLRNTPEFVSYKRSYQVQWGSIDTVIRHLEDMLSSFGIPLVYIDGKKVAQLAILDQGTPSKEELMSCIANRQEVEPLMASVVQQFRQGSRGHHTAATKVQSIWRMYRERRRFAHLKVATAAAVVIQRQWMIHRAHMKTRKLIAVNKDALQIRWKDTMDQFLQDWPKIRESKRVIIHIPSLSFPAFQCKQIPFYDCFQAAQMMRLADLRDPNVEIILVAPFKLEKEAFLYYMNVLKVAGASNPEGRLCMIVPENNKRLPPGLSLTKMVLMSSKTLKLLSSLVRGKYSYIVPGVMGSEEVHLAAKLNIPLLAAEPKVGQVLGTKSGGKTILESAEVATPIGAYHIKNTKDLFTVIARFVMEYRDIGRWLVKIDTEGGSRGHAVFDVSRLRCVTDLPQDQLTSELVFKELTDHAAKRVKILHTFAYPEWSHYAEVFNATGGCVEAVPSRVIASPTANLFVEPDGTVHLTSVVENVFSPSLSVLGCSFPQTSAPYDAIRDAALNIAQAAFRKKVIGYMSIDFVLYEKSDASGDRMIRMWAVDFDLHLTNNSCMHNWVTLLTGAQFNAQTGKCLLPTLQASSSSSSSVTAPSSDGGQPLTYIYSGLVYNPYIGAIRHAAFFSQCRQRGLSFDVQTRCGVAFHLVDTLLRGCFGAIAIGNQMSQCITSLHEIQQLVQAELPKDADSIAESNYSYFVTAVKHLLTRSGDRKGGEGRKQRVQSVSTRGHNDM